MKTKLIISLLILFASLTLYAQDEIVSIWLNDTTKIYTQPFNHANEIYWGPPVDITYGSGAAHNGNGMNNTNDIVGQLGENGGVPYAALVCDTLTAGGFTDWYLPTCIDIFCMHSKMDSIGGWASWVSENTYWMWSSYEYNDTIAQCKTEGFECWGVNKSTLANVRCVRKEYHLGIDNTSNKNTISITYTNMKHELCVEFVSRGAGLIEVYDIRGNKCMAHTLPEYYGFYKDNIKLHELIHGTYVVKLTTGNNVYTEKFVVH
jgi:hypothetical protein